ncbi:hypothetical protein NADFUDRAFT_79054 [Nadsonia fulvescens var. elongata DSM 6958]|uniref:Mitochondrial group I intron splicing factor CCM1 n=1 Tax=Nadsonia fulvescens var. elongata DSM 6958 TaxID=857566 RepID=A0A1E3PIE0_9ASCO|nr:hypothetical protein NADFUDRAFT_79054 [Nadsonia fulvescens var. elongata DSM 6958]
MISSLGIPGRRIPGPPLQRLFQRTPYPGTTLSKAKFIINYNQSAKLLKNKAARLERIAKQRFQESFDDNSDLVKGTDPNIAVVVPLVNELGELEDRVVPWMILKNKADEVKKLSNVNNTSSINPKRRVPSLARLAVKRGGTATVKPDTTGMTSGRFVNSSSPTILSNEQFQQDQLMRFFKDAREQINNTTLRVKDPEAQKREYITTLSGLVQEMQVDNNSSPREMESNLKQRHETWQAIKKLLNIIVSKSLIEEVPVETLTELRNLVNCPSLTGVTPQQAIKTVGDAIYSSDRLRLDAFNEKDYIAALFSANRKADQTQGLNIWAARMNHTTIASYWFWIDIGINQYIKLNQMQKVEQYAAESLQKFTYISPSTIVAIVNMYAVNGELAMSLKWYHTLYDMFVAFKNTPDEPELPEGVTEQLMSQWVQLGQHDKVTAVMGKVYNRKTYPNQTHFLTVLTSFLKNDYVNEAISIIEDIDRHKMGISLETALATFDKVTRNITLQSASLNLKPAALFEKLNGQIDTVVKSLIDQTPAVLDSAYFYKIWLRALSNSRSKDIMLVIHAMVKRGITPQGHHMVWVIKGLLARKQSSQAHKLLEQMETSFTKTPVTYTSAENEEVTIEFPQPDASIYALFIQDAARRLKFSEITPILARMASYGVIPNSALYNVLFHALYRQKQFGNVWGEYEAMLSRVKLDTTLSSGIDFTIYRTLWRVLLDTHRTPRASRNTISTANTNSDIPSLPELGNALAAPSPSPRTLFSRMINTPYPSPAASIPLLKDDLPVLVLQTFLVSGDISGALAVLRYWRKDLGISVVGLKIMPIINMVSKAKERVMRFRGRQRLISKGLFDSSESTSSISTFSPLSVNEGRLLDTATTQKSQLLQINRKEDLDTLNALIGQSGWDPASAINNQLWTTTTSEEVSESEMPAEKIEKAILVDNGVWMYLVSMLLDCGYETSMPRTIEAVEAAYEQMVNG